MMRSTRRRVAILVALASLASGWVLMGVGYHRTSKACYETRHANDREPEVYGGGLGIAIDLALWPVFQAGNAMSGIDCTPRPGQPVP